MAFPIGPILNLAAAGVGLLGSSSSGGGGSTAARVRSDLSNRTAETQFVSGRNLQKILLERLESFREGQSTPEQLELDLLGQTLAQQAVANLGRQEAGVSSGLTRKFAQRGLVGSGLEAAAQTQVASQFGVEKARAFTQESQASLLRRIQELNTIQSGLAQLAGIPAQPFQQQPVSQPDPLAALGGFFAQRGVEGLIGNLTAPSVSTQGIPAAPQAQQTFGGESLSRAIPDQELAFAGGGTEVTVNF